VTWRFGYGLSYTTFSYSDAKLVGGPSFRMGDIARISVDVKNSGRRAGDEVVQLYVGYGASSGRHVKA
jgi:beta-glucosidase